MENPFVWVFERIHETVAFLQTLSTIEILTFFGPALLLDFPRFVLCNVFVFFKELFFPRSIENTEWAKRLRGANPPLVSIVIAGYNEANSIEKCLRSLAENTYSNKEIIIVDDGSTDGMDKVCRRLMGEYQFRYVRHAERSGKPAGVNHGCRLARGEFILVGDADTTFDRDSVYQSMLPFHDPKVGAVSANILVRNVNASFATRMQALEYNIGVGVGRRFMANLDMLTNVSGAFGMFRRNVIEDVGGNDVGPGEDFDVTVKVRKAGWRIPFVPEAVCMTDVPVKVIQFIRQRIRWDQTTIRFRIRKHRDLYDTSMYDWKTTMAVFDTVFYDVVLLFIRIPYYSLLFYMHPNLVLKITIATWLFYFACDFINFWIVIALSHRRRDDIWLLPYLPFFSLWCFAYSFLRAYSYLDEWLFYSSYRDKYIPDRVQKQAVI